MPRSNDSNQRFEHRLAASLARLADAGAPSVDADRVLTRLRRRTTRRRVVCAVRVAALLALGLPLTAMVLNRPDAPRHHRTAAVYGPAAAASSTTTARPSTLLGRPDTLALHLRSLGLEGVAPWGDAWIDAPSDLPHDAEPIARAAVTLDWDWQAAVLAYPEWAGVVSTGPPRDDAPAVF